LLGRRRHEFLKYLRIAWLGQVMFEARFEQLLAAIQYPTARRLADIQLPFPDRSELRKPLEPHYPPHFVDYAVASAGIGSRN
jgi:hypothetical protein